MKKVILLALILVALSPIFGAARNGRAISVTALISSVGGSVKIINDTDADVQIHTGSGFVEINRTSSTSVSCEAGKEIRRAEKGKKGDVLFVIDDSMCGKAVKLSKYM